VALLLAYGLLNETGLASLFLFVMLFAVLLSGPSCSFRHLRNSAGRLSPFWPSRLLLAFLLCHFGRIHEAGILGSELLAVFFS
jgi:hypothetical protein